MKQRKNPLGMVSIFLATALSPLCWAQGFRFSRGQSVYVAAARADSRSLLLTGGDLRIEHRAREQFKKEKEFEMASDLRSADFVFVIVVDDQSGGVNEMALAVLPDEYQKFGKDLGELRSAALWQDGVRFKNGRHAALAGATLGLSGFFDRPSAVKGLVKAFHKQALGPGK